MSRASLGVQGQDPWGIPAQIWQHRHAGAWRTSCKPSAATTRPPMTEIAARSATAIGSLYRFFPTKEALGETLLRRFIERSGADLDELAARAGTLDGEELAERLIQWLVGLQSDSVRAGVAAILDARGDAPELRRAFRAQRRKQVASLLSKANPALGRERAQDRAAVVVFLLKGERAFAQDEPSAERRWIRELRRLVSRYVVEALKER
jgi:AcrR family transcriptional regulator